MRELIKSGVAVGNGAAINIPLGWIPNVVEVYNATDGTVTNRSWLKDQVIPFSSGGVTEIVVGDTIIGQTSHARGVVKQVTLYSGTWAGGDAAGFFVVDWEQLTGTFQGENVAVSDRVAGATNDATVTANVSQGYDSDTELAADNAAIVPYNGSSTEAKGFTIAAAIATEAKALRWVAMRDGP